MERRFYRKRNDRIVGGVCSGLADYFGMDKSIVRLLTFAAILASGVLPGLLVYILCVIIVPDESQTYRSPDYDGGYYPGEDDYREPWDREKTRRIFGIVLIAAGAILLMQLIFSWIDWRYIIAGLLVLCGLYILFNGRKF